jgi:hypothetical protein
VVIAVVALSAVVVASGVLVARRAHRQARAEELQILQGVRKVCKLSTVELSLADYARRTVPKTVDLPFTTEPEAFLFYSGVVSAGFDVCDEPTRIEVDYPSRTVRVELPPARILSLDMKRFEVINEHSGFLNSIAPDDRNKWFQEARTSLERGALANGALAKAETHARELFADFVERWGYKLSLTVGGGARAAAERDR